MKRKWFFFLLFTAFFVCGYFIHTQGKFSLPKPPPTQLTNISAYLDICKRATQDPQVFQTFKHHPIYNLFYENVSYEEGVEILRILKKNDPEILNSKALEKIRRIDCFGRPFVYAFDRIGPFSPTTLSYLKIASDLRMHFGPMEKIRIIEIGGGNGGLCKVLHAFFDVEQYTIVDLPETCELAKKHLQALEIERVNFVSPDEIKMQACDLLISQNGFSESSQTLQKKWIKKLFTSAQRGYIICHFYPKYYQIRAFKKKDLLKIIQKTKLKASIFPEEPTAGKNHFVLTWTT